MRAADDTTRPEKVEGEPPGPDPGPDGPDQDQSVEPEPVEAEPRSQPQRARKMTLAEIMEVPLKEKRRLRQAYRERIDLIRRGQRTVLPAYPPDKETWMFESIAAFKDVYRQSLPVWEPILDCYSVGRLFLYLSVILVPFGAFLMLSGIQARELRFDYESECLPSNNYLWLLRITCPSCEGYHDLSCSKKIEIPFDMKTPVFIYYEIEDFHLNHRYLVRSVDNDQLLGRLYISREVKVPLTPNSCRPLIKDENGKIYIPCGARANYMFSDSFTFQTERAKDVPLRKQGIAHRALRKYKYRNNFEITPQNYQFKVDFLNNFTKPRSWSKVVWDEWWKNGAFENEAFINWMVVSPFSTFRKLYAVIDSGNSIPNCPTNLLCKGNYTLNIVYRYDVEAVHGKKAIIFSTTTFMGTRNMFTPLFTMALGATLAVLGMVLLGKDKQYRTLQSHRRLTLTHENGDDEAYVNDVTDVYAECETLSPEFEHGGGHQTHQESPVLKGHGHGHHVDTKPLDRLRINSQPQSLNECILCITPKRKKHKHKHKHIEPAVVNTPLPSDSEADVLLDGTQTDDTEVGLGTTRRRRGRREDDSNNVDGNNIVFQIMNSSSDSNGDTSTSDPQPPAPGNSDDTTEVLFINPHPIQESEEVLPDGVTNLEDFYSPDTSDDESESEVELA